MREREDGWLWLDQATEDLRWARHLAKEGGHYLACFLSQQVAEKALKAYLYSRSEELVIGHSVEALCRRVRQYLPDLGDRCEAWQFLDNYYATTRYPDALPGSLPARVYNRRAADEAVTTAADVVQAIAHQMPPRQVS
jgi:HEPN domain-containing protein